MDDHVTTLPGNCPPTVLPPLPLTAGERSVATFTLAALGFLTDITSVLRAEAVATKLCKALEKTINSREMHMAIGGRVKKRPYRLRNPKISGKV